VQQCLYKMRKVNYTAIPTNGVLIHLLIETGICAVFTPDTVVTEKLNFHFSCSESASASFAWQTAMACDDSKSWHLYLLDKETKGK